MGAAPAPGHTVSTVPTWSPRRDLGPRLFQPLSSSTETAKRWAMVHSESPFCTPYWTRVFPSMTSLLIAPWASAVLRGVRIPAGTSSSGVGAT